MARSTNNKQFTIVLQRGLLLKDRHKGFKNRVGKHRTKRRKLNMSFDAVDQNAAIYKAGRFIKNLNSKRNKIICLNHIIAEVFVLYECGHIFQSQISEQCRGGC